jgi:antitoxin (DNA-binding transcriptional repressor) of toxin-antitoxin stability system
MIQIDLLQIQADPAHFIAQVVRGETIVVTRDNEPIAELRPIAPSTNNPRQIGLAKGIFGIPASFDGPLPEVALNSFDGREVIVEEADCILTDELDEWYRELQALGPAQYDPGEREQVQLLLDEADLQAKTLVRREISGQTAGSCPRLT